MRMIEIVTNDGSPLGIVPQTLWGDDFRIGLGGSEYLLMTLCEAWADAGHNVILYNNPYTTYRPGAKFEQKAISGFNMDAHHDIVIDFRSPNDRVIACDAEIKVWLSCDQKTIGNFANFSKYVDKIVCISEFHKQYFQDTYGIVDNVFVIDIPVRYQDFKHLNPLEHIPERIIFTSVPARGLSNLRRIWNGIVTELPTASLAITSDYRLWGKECGAGNEQFRSQFVSAKNVLFFGALDRSKYLQEVSKAQIILYPSNYDELFCVSIAEAEAMGVYPITSSTGALPTTNMGIVIDGSGDNATLDHLFIENAVNLIRNEDLLHQKQDEVQFKAAERFSIQNIMKQWDEVLEI